MNRFDAVSQESGVNRSTVKGVFITGTDTGVGKTIVSAALARMLHDKGVKVGVMKPVTSGCLSSPTGLVSADAELLAWAAGVNVTAEVTPYLLREPLAPSAAAEIEHIRIEFSRILAAFHRIAEQCDFVIVEGAGGLMVPLSGGLLVADLIKLLALPLLVVARPDLGTINHTVLTTFAARQLEINIRGVVISGYPETPSLAESTAPHLIDSLAGVPLLGRFPQIDSKDEKEVVIALAAWLSAQPATRILLREIGCE